MTPKILLTLAALVLGVSTLSAQCPGWQCNAPARPVLSFSLRTPFSFLKCTQSSVVPSHPAPAKSPSAILVEPAPALFSLKIFGHLRFLQCR